MYFVETMPTLLVANRGEIAIRICKTAKKKGWKTVAIYSDADRHALHISYADEAYRVGGSPSKDSYLNINQIIKIAKDRQVDYIHPGYGFLSENAEFAQAVWDNGITFVGPTAEAMQSLGVHEALQAKFVTGESISQAHQFVASGSAQLGFVAFSQVLKDGKIEGSVWIVPAHLYQQIRQDAVILEKGKGKPTAESLMKYLKSEKVRAIIKSYGYDC